MTCTPPRHTAAEVDLFVTHKFAFLFHFQTWTVNKHGAICQLTSAKFHFFLSLNSFTNLPPLLLNAFCTIKSTQAYVMFRGSASEFSVEFTCSHKFSYTESLCTSINSLINAGISPVSTCSTVSDICFLTSGWTKGYNEYLIWSR